MTKVCKVCGKEFETSQKNQKYCSKECKKIVIRDRNRRYYWNKKAKECCKKHGGIDNCPYPDCICDASTTVVCKHCGKPFIPTGRNHKFCSAKCRKASMRKPKRIYSKVCPECGKQFAATHFNQKYCSDECRKKVSSRYQHKHYMENHEHYLKIHREWKAKNKEHAYQVNQIWKKNNPDKVHEYNAKRYQEHKDEVNESIKKWRKENPERYKKTRMEWEKRNPDKVELYYEKSKARKYKKRHHITISYCNTHNDCLNCPYPYKVCLHE